MIKYKLDLEQYDWSVSCYFGITSILSEEILEDIYSIGATKNVADSAYKLLKSEQYNIGLTYTNKSLRKSVLVVGLANSADEYANTLFHEISHLAIHIANANDIDLDSESYCYLIGEVARLLNPTISPFLCGCCRDEAIKKASTDKAEEAG